MSMLNLNNYLTSLSNTPDHNQLFTQANHLVKVQRQLQGIIPAQFRNSYTVGKYTDHGQLIIYVNNGAIATQLRNSAESIQQKMSQAGINVDSIKFSIQPQLVLLQKNDRHITKRPLSPVAIENLDQLSSALPFHSPLRASLQTLLANSYKRK